MCESAYSSIRFEMSASKPADASPSARVPCAPPYSDPLALALADSFMFKASDWVVRSRLKATDAYAVTQKDALAYLLASPACLTTVSACYGLGYMSSECYGLGYMSMV